MPSFEFKYSILPSLILRKKAAIIMTFDESLVVEKTKGKRKTDLLRILKYLLT